MKYQEVFRLRFKIGKPLMAAPFPSQEEWHLVWQIAMNFAVMRKNSLAWPQGESDHAGNPIVKKCFGNHGFIS